MCGSGCQTLNHTHSRILQSDISSQAGRWDLWKVWPNTTSTLTTRRGFVCTRTAPSGTCQQLDVLVTWVLPFRCRGFNISKVSVCNFWSSPCNVDVNDSQLPHTPSSPGNSRRVKTNTLHGTETRTLPTQTSFSNPISWDSRIPEYNFSVPAIGALPTYEWGPQSQSTPSYSAVNIHKVSIFEPISAWTKLPLVTSKISTSCRSLCSWTWRSQVSWLLHHASPCRYSYYPCACEVIWTTIDYIYIDI